MKATLEQLAQLSLFSALKADALAALQPHTHLQLYRRKDTIFGEGDSLPLMLHILFAGALQVQKSTATGKETILRSLRPGDLFAVSALFGETCSSATFLAIADCQVLTISETALLDAIQHTPTLAIQLLMIFNQRLQQLHNLVHGLVSERAVVRLAQLIQYNAVQQGTDSTATGEHLRVKLPYYQMARSIGITYEECSRLMKGLSEIVRYSRGGNIIILDWEGLAAIASGKTDLV